MPQTNLSALIINPDVKVREEIASELMEQMGFGVTYKDSVDEVFGEEVGEDLIILDLSDHIEDYLEIVKTLSEENPNIPIVVTAPRDLDWMEALSAGIPGAVESFHSPLFDEALVIGAVKRALIDTESWAVYQKWLDRKYETLGNGESNA